MSYGGGGGAGPLSGRLRACGCGSCGNKKCRDGRVENDGALRTGRMRSRRQREAHVEKAQLHENENVGGAVGAVRSTTRDMAAMAQMHE